jgi:hypothetical protein
VKALDGSARTKVLFWLYWAVAAASLAVVLGLLISLGGYFIADWEDAPVPQIVGWLIPAFIAMVVFRLALAWSMRRDQRKGT